MNPLKRRVPLTNQQAVSFAGAVGLTAVLAGGLIPDGLFTSGTASSSPCPEPNIEIAKQWWPELTNVYTPIGWKNHLFRFNVFYNGVILAEPQPEPSVKALDPWKDLGVQIAMVPGDDGEDPYAWQSGAYQMSTEVGRQVGRQGWLDRPAPVLWTQWRQPFKHLRGIVLRQEVFAHVPGSEDIQTGTEPLFAWVRVSIEDTHPFLEHGPLEMLVRISRPHIQLNMNEGRNLTLREAGARYPRTLTFVPFGEADRSGGMLLEKGNRVRIAVLPGQALEARLLEQPPNKPHDYLRVTMPATQGAFVDLLLPMLPTRQDVFEAEMALGRDAALDECDRYWSRKPVTAAYIETPEPFVNEYLRRNIQFGEIIAQKMPGNGFYVNLTGSHKYARVWATPNAMFDTMLLDTLGYHRSVDRYLEIYRAEQGTATPPGPHYTQHSGYLASPRSLESIDWLTDHGAILHAACYHALITGDMAFIERWREPIIKACEFIRDARAIRGHTGVPGVLPPAVATDIKAPVQAVWNVAWHYKGLSSALRLLERLGDPHVTEFSREADDFRKVFVQALREQAVRMPTWTDHHGRRHPVVPYSLSEVGNILHPFYLDTGPLVLVFAGLLEADDDLMVSARAFFREGPNWRFFDPLGNHNQPAVLVHEISSCEPCLSLNIFHSHQLGDRLRYLEGLYSILTGNHSQQTHIACETRGGITGITGHLGIYLIRLAVVDDALESDVLHLLRMVPLAWLSEQTTTRFENIPTLFGPVTVNFRLTNGGTTLDVQFSERFRHSPAKILLHVPPLSGLNKVVVNGKSNSVGAGEALTILKP